MELHGDYTTNNALYDIDAVGYQVFILLDDKGDKNELNDVYGLIGIFETEQVRKGAIYATEALNQRGEDIHQGISLGLSYYTGKTYTGVRTELVTIYGAQYYLADGTQEVYRRTSTPDYLYQFTFNDDYDFTTSVAPNAATGYTPTAITARTALDTFMSDFGFGTGTGYNYKIQDSNFVSAATYDELGTATYNGNAIVVPQPEEDPDVEEPTDNDEVPDEGDIDEELPDEGDIDEEPIPDEPVPETGDASAAVAVALTAAALVAAAGLAVVLKKAR